MSRWLLALRSSSLVLAIAPLAAACSREAPPALEPSPHFESDLARSRSARNSRTTVLERHVCERLDGSRVFVDDVPGGVALDFRPTQTTSLSLVREGADLFQKGMRPTGRVLGAEREEDGCDLVDLAEHRPDVRVHRLEDGVRIELTTADPADVADLRADARDFADDVD